MAKFLLMLSFLAIWLLDVYGVYKTFMGDSQFIYLWGALVFILPIVFYKMWHTDINYVLSPSERWKEDEYFKQRINYLENKYKNKPAALRNLTVLLAVLGYIVMFAMVVAVALAGVVLALAINNFFGVGYYSIIAAVPFTVFAFKLLWPFIRPSGGDRGVRLTPQDAPRLFGLLRKIEKRAKGHKFQRVFVDMEMNASVSRSGGMLGLFGFGPVTINLGLPLMQALSVNQLAGVIAHEYGHVAGNHNALAHWVYRIRKSWIGIGEKMHSEEMWHILQLAKIYNVFIKRFKIYSFVLSRQCEYEADEFAAKIAGAKNISEALVAIEFKSKHLHADFWDKIWKLIGESSKPCGRPYSSMTEFFRDCDVDDDVKSIKNIEANFDSTHPALPKRISSIGVELQKNKTIDETSAHKLLGSLETQLKILFDDAWVKQNMRKWHARHTKHQSALNFIQNSNMKALSTSDLIKYISAAQTIDDEGEVIFACRELLEREPDNSSAKVSLLGYELLHENKDLNLVKLDELVGAHPEHIAQASSFAIKYLTKHKRHKEVKVHQYRLDDWNYKNEAAEAERSTIFTDDKFAYHSMNQKYIGMVKAILSHNKIVKKAWLVRKQVHYFKDIRPLFVLFLGHGWFASKHKQATIKQIEKELLNAGLSSFVEVFWVDDFKSLKTKVNKVQGSLVYKK